MMKMVVSLMFLLGWVSWGLTNWWVVLVWLILSVLLMTTSVPLYEVYSVWGNNLLLDSLSLGLMILSGMLLILMYLSSSVILNKKFFTPAYNFFMLGLLLVLIISFMMSNFLAFYFFFEVSLIPTLGIIMGWGYQPERLQAGVYFMQYTIMASLPLLLVLVVLGSKFKDPLIWNSLFNNYALLSGLSLVLKYFFMASVAAAFLVKLPMFMVHLWLPKAHVEAPVSGSMILAGVLLKLGGYGLSRVMLKFYSILASGSAVLLALSLIGMVFIGLVCCRLNDLKALVAYSSVAHMGLVICGLLSGVSWGMNGGVMMMISHGLSSSGLFCFVNLVYERLGSRSMFMNMGVINIIPLFSLLMFMLCAANISAPPTINLLSEISLMFSVYFYDSMTMVLFPVGSFLGAVFTFYLFSYSNHGKTFFSGGSAIEGKFLEFHVIVLHLVPVNFLILGSELFFVVN